MVSCAISICSDCRSNSIAMRWISAGCIAALACVMAAVAVDMPFIMAWVDWALFAIRDTPLICAFPL
jgi:hypothetical protein